MLLLVTIGLVLVAAVSLVIGFVTNELPWIYLSIVCSVVAAGVLVLFSRMSRQVPTTTAEGPAPLAEGDEPTLATTAVATDTAAVVVPEAAAVEGGEGFPIEDYDKLRVNEILPQLSGLSVAELEQVRAREQAGKNRASVIARIDDLISQQETEPAAEAAAAGVAGAGAELAAAQVGASTGAPAVGGQGEELDNIDDLIEDYDKLSSEQIIPLLAELDEDELEDVAAYEEDHKNRDEILDHIDALLEGEEVRAEVKAAPAKKVAGKKAAAKKAAAKKATAKKVATAKKSAAKVGATAKKAAPAAKKAAAKKVAAPAKKAAATKKASGNTAVTGSVKKTTAKKATKATKR